MRTKLLALEWMATEDPLRDGFLDASDSPNNNNNIVEANIRDVETRYAFVLLFFDRRIYHVDGSK